MMKYERRMKEASAIALSTLCGTCVEFARRLNSILQMLKWRLHIERQGTHIGGGWFVGCVPYLAGSVVASPILSVGK